MMNVDLVKERVEEAISGAQRKTQLLFLFLYFIYHIFYFITSSSISYSMLHVLTFPFVIRPFGLLVMDMHI